MTERKSLGTERAELAALADELADKLDQLPFGSRNTLLRRIERALRSLAARDQEPVALAHVSLEDDGLFADLEVLDGTNLQPSMSPVALYLSPPPAAGWDQAIEACKKVAEKWLESFMGGEAYVARSIVNAIEALRHNAPSDSGANFAKVILEADAKEPEATFSNYQEMMDWLEAKSPGAGDGMRMPDHGGDDAGVGLYTVQEVETALKGALAKLGFKESALVAANASTELQNDLGDMLRALGMSDAAQPKSPHEVFQSAIAEMKRQMANASAEARLREALEKIAGSHWERVGRCQTDVDDVPDLTAEDAMREARKALSTHPHASDCDKQEATKSEGIGLAQAGTAREAPGSATGCSQRPNTQVDALPSDRTADVTVDELAAMIVPEGAQVIGAQDAKQIAAEILDTFTVGRR